MKRYIRSEEINIDVIEDVAKVLDSTLRPDIMLDEVGSYLIPKTGKSDSVAGELIRAFREVMNTYDSYGYTFYDTDGQPKCGSAAWYLAEVGNVRDDLEWIAVNDTDGSEYEAEMEEVAERIADAIRTNINLVSEQNTDDCNKYMSGSDWNEFRKTYEFESGIPEEIVSLADSDSGFELSYYIDELSDKIPGKVTIKDNYTALIQQLTKEDMNTLEELIQDANDEIIDSLEKEYGPSKYWLGTEV